MSRALSSTALASAFAQETDQVWLLLLTVTHPQLTTIRLVNNTVDIVSRGQTFIAFPFELELPQDDGESMPSASIRIDNVDQTIVRAFRALSTPPLVLIEAVLASSTDTVELSLEGLTFKSLTYDAATITAQLGFEPILVEPIAVSMTPTRFPGIF